MIHNVFLSRFLRRHSVPSIIKSIRFPRNDFICQTRNPEDNFSKRPFINKLTLLPLQAN